MGAMWDNNIGSWYGYKSNKDLIQYFRPTY